MVQRSALVSFMILLASAGLFPASHSPVSPSSTNQPAAGQQPAPATPLKPADWGAPPIDVSHDGHSWLITGQKQRVTLSESDLSATIQASGVTWTMVPSGAHDLRVRVKGEEAWLRLADARSIRIVPYRTGFKTGVKIALGDFRTSASAPRDVPLDVRLVLTMALEGGDEDLTFEVVAIEGNTTVRELNWPTAMDGREIDATLLSNDDGVLLPRDWPKAYHPITRQG